MRPHPHWMGDLFDSSSTLHFTTTPINKLLIPGTHDSGSYGMIRPAAAQQLTIADQLYYGVRYFDCRVMRQFGTYYFAHGVPSNNIIGQPGDTPEKQTFNVLFDIRTFMIANPLEVIILKFQNITGFGHDDYMAFMNLLKSYLTFDLPNPNDPTKNIKCELASFTQNNAHYLGQQSLETLTASGKRVIVFFEVKDVPTDQPTANAFWEHAFKYVPELPQKGTYGLWDPFWGAADGIKINDNTAAGINDWWNWHEVRRAQWEAAGTDRGFYAAQLQMTELPGTFSYPLYFNISEQMADSTYYMLQDPTTGDYISNNVRNVQRMVHSCKNGKPYNILQFDYFNMGSVCDAIVDYYTNYTPPPPTVVHLKQHIKLKLNGLERYPGPTQELAGLYYPSLYNIPATLYLESTVNKDDTRELFDGDVVYIKCVVIAGQGNKDKMEVSSQPIIYYTDDLSTHTRWSIRKGSPGAKIEYGDYVWFENHYYLGQFLTLYSTNSKVGLTTAKMTLPTRWIIQQW